MDYREKQKFDRLVPLCREWSKLKAELVELNVKNRNLSEELKKVERAQERANKRIAEIGQEAEHAVGTGFIDVDGVVYEVRGPHIHKREIFKST